MIEIMAGKKRMTVDSNMRAELADRRYITLCLPCSSKGRRHGVIVYHPHEQLHRDTAYATIRAAVRKIMVERDRRP